MRTMMNHTIKQSMLQTYLACSVKGTCIDISKKMYWSNIGTNCEGNNFMVIILAISQLYLVYREK